MAIKPNFTIFFFFISFIFANSITTIHSHDTSNYSKCTYNNTNPKGYINYLQIFYCKLSKFPIFGFILLLLWLVILFYMLSNTASEYLCPAVEHLSKILKLSPALAGTTLLPLGNGSPDVFASIISFTASKDGGNIGLNSILGGSIFVTTVVVGVLSFLLSYRRKYVKVDQANFIRDVVFLLFGLLILLVVIMIGKITLWASLVFAFSYIIYICLVCYMHFISIRNKKVSDTDTVCGQNGQYDDDLRLPLLVSISSLQKDIPKKKKVMKMIMNVMGLPFYLPRRLTIPLVTKEKWSKPFGVISVVLAPIMLALILTAQHGQMGSKVSLVICCIALVIGIALGSCTFVCTSSTMAPQKCLFIWYASGFLMSVTWTYMTAKELVSLLESLGTIIGMKPSILGLTVLAWGNSLGDMTANVAMAMYDGPDGAQIAIAGCFAGPVFNIFMGLGFSFVSVCWLEYPAPYMVPVSPYLCETVGFLIVGLLWALVVLPKRQMRLDQTLGGGLLAIYFCFLFIKIARAVGLIDVSISNLLKIV